LLANLTQGIDNAFAYHNTYDGILLFIDQNMDSPHYQILGSIESPQGALGIIFDEEGMAPFLVEVLKAALVKEGFPVTPENVRIARTVVDGYLAKHHQEMSLLGVPQKLQSLMGFTKKADVEKYCSGIHISEDELYLLIHNHNQIRYSHMSKFREFVPQQLKISPSDIQSAKFGVPHKLINKLRGIFNDRKHVMVHLFEKGIEWHCFYYTYKDMDDKPKGHWINGAHLHYVSYLWSNLNKASVWDAFDSKDVSFKGVHIKLKPLFYPKK